MRKDPPNQYRRRSLDQWSSEDSDGMNGAFQIPLPGHGHKVLANCIVSDGYGMQQAGLEPFEHVSLHIQEYGKQRTPTWEEMCQVKDIFWGEEECVVQYHPPKSDYVNNHPCVLHLWKWTGGSFPVPSSLCVGIKSLGVLSNETVLRTSITCPQCGWVSYNQNDIKERYCGHCHQWHENMKGQK